MCVFRGVFSPQQHHHLNNHHHPHLLLCLAERLTRCLSTRLTCLHGSGPPPALWLPPIDLFQETLESGQPEINEEGVGVWRKEGHFTGVPLEKSFLSFCGSYLSLECVETFRKVQTFKAHSVFFIRNYKHRWRNLVPISHSSMAATSGTCCCCRLGCKHVILFI